MIAVLKQGTTVEQREHLVQWLKSLSLDVHISEGREVTVLGLIGDTSRVDMELLGSLEMVESGGVIVEYDKLIDRQLERAAITATAGFAPMFGEAVCALEV